MKEKARNRDGYLSGVGEVKSEGRDREELSLPGMSFIGGCLP